jgi:hypothetical protein
MTFVISIFDAFSQQETFSIETNINSGRKESSFDEYEGAVEDTFEKVCKAASGTRYTGTYRGQRGGQV